MLEWIFLVLKVSAGVVGLLMLQAFDKHWKVQQTLRRLEAQGITNYPGNDTFLIGPLLGM